MDDLTTIDTANEVAVYAPFRQELAKIKDSNATLVFDYESPSGNKDARSHVYKLRQSKAAVEKARKAENEAGIAYKKKVDAQAKEIIAEFDEMIELHDKPLREIEEREAKRQAEINELIVAIQANGALTFAAGSAAIGEALDRVKAVEATIESFGTRMPDVAQAKESALGQLEGAFLAAKAMEAERAELERLRQQEAERKERERAEREARDTAERKAAEEKAEADRIAQAERDAAERERRAQEAALETARREKAEAEQRAADAEAAAQREKEAADKRAAEAVEAERKRAAEEKAEQERKAAEAVEAERRRVEAEEQRRRNEEEARQADQAHRAKIEKAALDALLQLHEMSPTAEGLLTAIRDGLIPHVTINY